jgi:hypothetical protein
MTTQTRRLIAFFGLLLLPAPVFSAQGPVDDPRPPLAAPPKPNGGQAVSTGSPAPAPPSSPMPVAAEADELSMFDPLSELDLGFGGAMEAGLLVGHNALGSDTQWLIDSLLLDWDKALSTRVRLQSTLAFSLATSGDVPTSGNNSSQFFSPYRLTGDVNGGTFTVAAQELHLVWEVVTEAMEMWVGQGRVPFGMETLAARY